MFNKLRYTSSSFFAVVITLITFVGMSLLIAPTDYRKSMDLEIGDFSTIRDMKAPNVTKTTKKNTIPEKKEVKQPPATPELNISQVKTESGPKIFQGHIKSEIESIQDSITSSLNINNYQPQLNGGLTNVLSIQPIYPIKQLVNKTEGWVQVEFTVNELGHVVNASVIDSQPARVFNAAALKAIKKSKFKPLMIDGKAVSQTATQVYEFKLEKSN